MSGHHTVVCRHCFIATVSGWPSCANFSAWQRSCFGTIIWVPQRTSSPIALYSPCTSRYSLISIACHLPFKKHSCTLFSCGSCLDTLSISRLSRQQALILELPTLHTLLFCFGLLTVALGAAGVTMNLQCSWGLECISLWIYRAASWVAISWS